MNDVIPLVHLITRCKDPHFRERTKEKGGKSWPIHVKIVVQWPMNLVICVTLVAMKPSAVFAENPISMPPICAKINCRP
jgi:hypothetical protein